jgi:UDP-glucose 4-epimerase
MKALVTGAYGFIGRHVCRQLSRMGVDVVGMGHGSWGRGEWRAWGLREWRSADVTLDTLAVYASEPDLIIHCAGGASVGFSVLHPYQDFVRSVVATAGVLEYARQWAPIARVVCISSAGVYGTSGMEALREESRRSPISPYAVHKAMAEDLCAAYCRSFGMSAVVVRLFSVYGPGLRKQLLWDACGKLTCGEGEFAGTGEELRDWIHVEDAAALLIAASKVASPDCPVFNGGTGNGVRVREMVEAIACVLQYPEDIRFNGMQRAGDPKALIADIERSRALGWTPGTDWHAGVREYVAWYRAESK